MRGEGFFELIRLHHVRQAEPVDLRLVWHR